MIANELKLNGRVYRPETKTTSTGKAITRFGLQFYNGKDKDGNTRYAFVNCVYFGEIKLVEKSEVVVSGYLVCDEWTDKNGVKRSNLSIVCKTIGNGFEAAQPTTEPTPVQATQT